MAPQRVAQGTKLQYHKWTKSRFILVSEIIWLTTFERLGRCVAKFVARLLATAALWVRIQTLLKNTKWATEAKEWPTHSNPPKK